jgi:GNAT superfamily N-acetyltransferase
MEKGLSIKRTHGSDPDFQLLITHLDHELWVELKDDQATYDQFNKVPDIKTAIVVYSNSLPVAIGCFKKFNDDTIEIKRMFVEKEFRGKGISKTVLNELEKWANESGFTNAVLETSQYFKAARSLYENAGYVIVPNYGQYKRSAG